MSKQVLINQIQDSSGNRFGQVSRPDDLMHAQEFSREHAESITRDYLSGGADVPQIAGFNYVLDGGLQVHVNAPGRIYGTDGKLFEMLEAKDVQINLSAANQTLARFDLIYALLEEDAAAAEEFRPFVRLRSQTELANGVVPYPPSQFNQPTELHNRATVMVRAGTAALAPVAPVVNANEVPLYLMRVNAGATQLRDTDVSDLRAAVRSLISVSRRVDELTSRLNAFLQTTRTVNARDVLIGGGAGDYVGRTLQQYISDVVSASSENVDGLLRPEITTASGKLGSTRQGEVVDVPVISQVVFGDRAYSLSPARFSRASGTNPRYFNKSSTTEKTSTELPFSLGMITEIDTDGVGDFARRIGTLPVARMNAACAADSRYVYIFGGTGQSGSALGDWLVYDTLADTFVERAFIGDTPPSSNRPFMVSVEGDTSRQLLLATTTPQGQSRWFLIDPVTRQSEEISGAPQGRFFIADAIRVETVFIIAVAADGSKTYWTYNVGFTQVTTTGQTPTCLFEHAAGCYYRENQFVLFENDPGVLASGRTYVFDYPSLTWSRLRFAQAYGGTESSQQSLSSFRMTNVTGRPMIVGGGSDSTAWELTPGEGSSGWRMIPTQLPLVRAVGFASLLDYGVPRGRGFIFGGLNALLNTSDDVYAFARGGIVETTFEGQTALTLGADASFASFLIPDLTLSFDPLYLFVALVGDLPRGSVKLEYSFDGGRTFIEFTTETYYNGFPVSNVAGTQTRTRTLKITLYHQGAVRPVLAKLNEFMQSIDAAFQVVLRYDFLNGLGTRYLCMDRHGYVTLEMGAQPSTEKKCLLSKLTPTEVQDFINQRSIHIKYRGTQANGVTPVFKNEIPATPKVVNAYKVKADGTLADLADPLVQFGTDIMITGLANGESYVLEIGA